jgi:aryl-alcohol dehydrogenase-like predicted oxidoreductase
MNRRRFGRTGWEVSEVGYGMWGLAGWTGSDDDETRAALDRAVALGCNFFDTAWGYGAGKSEQILGELVRRHPGERLYVATKLPPKNFKWPSRRGYTLEECFPPDHIREYAEKSLANLGTPSIDLLQFHVWEDAWARDERWQRAMGGLRDQGIIKAVGISVNRWEPWNGMEAIRTGLIDAVQVIYNIFDQAPEDQLFPLCREHDVAVIARVPFDEGTLTGNLTLDSAWPEGDWRNTYFVPQNLRASVERAERLRPEVPAGMTMPELALRWILMEPTVSTIIPGMRRVRHVESNLGVSGRPPLDPALMARLKAHRWDRTPTEWSQ